MPELYQETHTQVAYLPEIWFNTPMPVTVKVHLYATFKLIAGQKEFELVLPDQVNIGEAIHIFLESAPALKPHWLNQEGVLHVHVHSFLNGTDVSTLPLGMATRLKQGDILEFIPPVTGG
jgi:molybdopterin converting factor small subunit